MYIMRIVYDFSCINGTLNRNCMYTGKKDSRLIKSCKLHLKRKE